MNIYKHLLKSVVLASLLLSPQLFAQWQPIPEDDITLTGIAPAVRADTSRKADGRVVDQDTLAAKVFIEHAGYYRIFPQVWLDSGNEQRNESYFLTIEKDGQVYYPLDPNAGDVRVVPDDTVKYVENDLYFETDAGLWYLEAGMNDIWLHHYAKIADQYPQYINYYPDGQGIHGSESIYIWEYIIFKPEPKVDGAVNLVFTNLDTCIENDIARPIIAAGDTLVFDVVAKNMQTGFFRNGLPSATMLLNMPPHFQPLDFSLTPDLDGIPGSTPFRWEITQLRDSTISALPITIHAIALQEIEDMASLDFNAEFVVPNDIDNSNNSDAATIFPATPASCPTDLAVELFSTDIDRYVMPGDTVEFKAVLKNVGENPGFDIDLNLALDNKIQILELPTGMSFVDATHLTLFYSEMMVGMSDTLTLYARVNNNIPASGTLYNQAEIVTDFDTNPANNQDDDLLNIGFGGFADMRIAQVIQTDSVRNNNGSVEKWASIDSTFKIQLAITNQSEFDAFNVTVADTLPEGVAAQGFSGRLLTWNFAKISSGAVQNIELLCSFTDTSLVDGSQLDNIAGVLAQNEDLAKLADNYSLASLFPYKYIPPVEYADLALTLDVFGDSSVVAGSDTIAAGFVSNPFSFRLSVQNNGPFAAKNLRIAQQIPGGLQNLMFSTQPTVQPSDSAIWIVPTLAVGERWQVDWSAIHEQNVTLPKLLSLTALVSSQLDRNRANNVDTALYMLLKEPDKYVDLYVKQKANTDSVLVSGQTPLNFVTKNEFFSYDIVLKNNGDLDAENISITDSLAADLNFISAEPQAQQVGTRLFWNVADLAVDDSLLIQVNCRVPEQTFAGNYPFINTVSAESAQEPDSLKRDNRSELPVFYYENLQPFSDLVVRQTVFSDSSIGNTNWATFGENVTFHVSIKNQGNATAQTVIVQDTLSTDLTILSTSPAAQINGTILTWNLENLSVGDSTIVEIHCTVSNKNLAFGEMLSSSAKANASNEPDSLLADNAAKSLVYFYPPLAQAPDLAVTQYAITDSSLTAGASHFDFVTDKEIFELQLHVKNHGHAPAETISLTNNLPDGLVLLSSEPQGVYANEQWSWNMTELAANDSFIVSLICQVADQNFAPNHAFTNSALVNAENEPDSLLSDNSCTHNLFYYPTVVNTFNVSIRQAVQTDSVLQSGETTLNFVKKNEVFLYSLWIKNIGMTAENVHVINALPAGVQLVQAMPEAEILDDSLSWHLGSLADGDSTLIQLICRVDNADFVQNHPFINNAKVTATDEPADMLADNQTSLAVFYYAPEVKTCDLALTQTAQTDSLKNAMHYVTNNDVFFYTLAVKNIGENIAENVVVSDSLPHGLDFVSANPAATVNGRILTWSVGTLVKDATLILAVQCRVQKNVVPTNSLFTNKALATATNEPVNLLTDNYTEFSVHYYAIKHNYDLAVSYSVNADTVLDKDGVLIPAMEKQGQAHFVIQVQNKGPIASQAATLLNVLPDDLTVDNLTHAPLLTDGHLGWQLPELDAGQSWQVEYTGVYSGAGTLPVFMDATTWIQADNDTNAANNSARVDFAVYEQLVTPKLCDVWIMQTAQSDSIVVSGSDSVFYTHANETFAYVIKIGNQSDHIAEQVVVKCALPQNADFVSAQPSAKKVTADSCVWELGALAASAKIMLYMQPKDDLPIGKNAMLNTALVSAANEDPTKLHNNSSIFTVINFIPVPDPLVVDILVDPERIDVTDSAAVQVRFSQPVKTWDLIITLPDGQQIFDFADRFIANTKIEPNRWYVIDEYYVHPTLTNANKIDEVVFTAEGTSIYDYYAVGEDELTVVSSDEMFLDLNVFRVGLDDLVKIRFKLSGGADCVLSVFDLAGHKIADVDQSFYPGGWNEFAWDGRTNDGSYVGSGTYLITLHHVYGSYYKKMIIVR